MIRRLVMASDSEPVSLVMGGSGFAACVRSVTPDGPGAYNRSQRVAGLGGRGRGRPEAVANPRDDKAIEQLRGGDRLPGCYSQGRAPKATARWSKSKACEQDDLFDREMPPCLAGGVGTTFGVRSMTPRRAIAWVVVCVAVVVAGTPARAAEVDLALVLAVDISSSVSEERYQLQMQGYAEAFRDPTVVQAIERGQLGAIAVTLVQWAGYNEYRQTIDWAVVHDAKTAERFASAIAETRRPPGGSTSISGAIDFSARLLRRSGFEAARRMIDISADGSNNNGRLPAAVRDEAVSSGIVINGLPILSQEPTLDNYFREQVIGGPGAFLIVAESFESFAMAIRRKLIVEIASAVPVTALPEREGF